jgi:serine protease Do
MTLPKSESVKQNNSDRVTSAGEAYSSVSEVYYAVCDSVVEITTETVQTSIWMGQYISTGAGSGVIIDGSGLIITNNHVIEGAGSVIVRLTDGSEYEATLVGADSAVDIAIIRINPQGRELTVATIGCSSDLVVGEDVVAIGNPLGSLGGTLTTGIISATERTLTIDGEEMVLLQTNAAINPGNSGGGLFNMAGQLIGVVNAKAAGDDVEGLGFAIPIDFAHKIAEDLINYGYVRGVVDHGLTLLDVTVQNLPAAYRKYGVTSVGVVILQSKYNDELKYGDYIVSANGIEIDSSRDVELILKSLSVGDKVALSIVRENKIVEVEIILQEKIPDSISFD